MHLARAVLHQVQLRRLRGERRRARARRPTPARSSSAVTSWTSASWRGLPHSSDEEVDELVGALGDRVAKPQEALRALLDREHGPRLLRLACARDGAAHLVRGRHGDLADELPGGGRVATDAIGRRRGPPDAPGSMHSLTHARQACHETAASDPPRSD